MSEKTGDEAIWEMRLAEVAKNLEENNFNVTVLPDMATAAAYFKNKILAEALPATISVGGSETVRLSGLYDVLEKSGAEFINPYVPGLSPEEALARRRRGYC